VCWGGREAACSEASMSEEKRRTHKRHFTRLIARHDTTHTQPFSFIKPWPWHGTTLADLKVFGFRAIEAEMMMRQMGSHSVSE